MATNKVRKGITQAETSLRCKLVAWNACRNVLPVKSRLLVKGAAQNDICPCCGEGNETTTHAFLLCEEVKPVWFASPLGLRVESLQNVSTLPQWMDQCVDMLDKEAMGIVCAIMWVLWHKRNAWVFLKKRVDCTCTEVIEKAMLQCTVLSNVEEEKLCWRPPPSTSPYVKANFVAFVRPCFGTGMGVIIRDSKSRTRASGTVFLPQYFKEDEIAEAVCYRWAIRLSKKLGYSDVKFETECERLHTRWIQLQSEQVDNNVSEFDSLLLASRKMIHGTQSTMTLATSDANKVARCLAELASYYGQRVWIGKVPNQASVYLDADLLATADLSIIL